ncbi:hypothetical protein D6D13_01262 [Aureobasidium pullulans]|uniref:Uncharacterized protein n=1 Tax=Aureobasidium pullulans TaxID=5580 RepID=A0A4V4J2J4_AURPU|nr:hypothetical protein D6D13_01262 [Aureobasidium pullulans]
MEGSMILLVEKNSPREIAQVIDAVMKMRSIAAVASTTPATVAGIGSVSVSTSAIIECKKRAKKSTATSKNAHAETSPRAAGSIALTCTFHSWMAFRSADYYSPIFNLSSRRAFPNPLLERGRTIIEGQVEHPC